MNIMRVIRLFFKGIWMVIKFILSILILLLFIQQVLSWAAYFAIVKPKANDIAQDITSYIQINERYISKEWVHNYVTARKSSGYIKDSEHITIIYSQPSNDRRFEVTVYLSGTYLSGLADPTIVVVNYYGVNYGDLPEEGIYFNYRPDGYEPDTSTSMKIVEKVIVEAAVDEPSIDEDLAYLGTDFYFTEYEMKAIEAMQSSCIACHGMTLEGLVGPSLINLNEKYSKDEILEIIVNGKGNMPAMFLDEESKIAIVEYLYSLN